MGRLGVNEIIKPCKEEILKVLEKNRIQSCFVFGSVARGEADETSDVDIFLITPFLIQKGQLTELKTELELLLNKKVDIVDLRALPKYILAFIRNDQIDIKNI